MCGESARTRLTSSSRGPRQIELAVRRRDLLGVRHAVLRLRRERRLGQHVVEQPRCDLGASARRPRRRRRRARRRTPPAPRSAPRRAPAVVRWIVTPVRASPAISARSTGAAPRQRGSSDGWTLSQSARVEQRLGDQQPVRGDDDGVGRDLDVLVEPRGLRDRDAEPLGDLLRRRSARACARGRAACRAASAAARRRASARAARARRRRTARSRRPRCGPSRTRTMRGRSAPSASRRASGVVRSIISTPSRWSVSCCTHARGVAVELVAHVVAVLVLADDRHLERALDRDGDALDREAALVGDVGLVAALDDLRVRRRASTSSSSGWKTKTRRSTPTCVAARPMPFASRISSFIRSTRLLQLVVELLDRRAPPSSARRRGTGGSARARSGAAPRAPGRAPRP